MPSGCIRPEGNLVRIEDRHPGKTAMTDEGFWVSESMVSETVDIREGSVAMVWASQGIASIMPVAETLMEPLHAFIHQVVSGRKNASRAGRMADYRAADPGCSIDPRRDRFRQSGLDPGGSTMEQAG